MVDILNYGALNLAMAIGYRTGLFDVMDAFDSPRTVAAIAERGGLNARYVREWLGVMSASGVVELIKQEGKEGEYFLPKEHATFLTRKSGDSNMGVYTQEIPLLTTCAMEQVIKGFSTGKGVPYSFYPKFQAFMSELSNAKHRKMLVDQFLPSVDDGNIVRRMKEGIRVCDFGCGEGVALLLMAASFPESTFVGIDLDEEAAEEGMREARKQGLDNVEFVVKDAAAIETEPQMRGLFDYVAAFDAIHDQTAPLAALRGAYHLLAPGGVFSMVDIAAETEQAANLNHPMGPFLYTVSLMHCMPVGLVDGGEGLGMMWGRQKAVEMLGEAGFESIEVVEMDYDPFNTHYLCRK
jgi:ubiquinone/menaquinone biosynthesis C-methylase UbiE